MEPDTRNLTLRLSADLIRKAKVYAAERDTSISSLVEEFPEQTVSSEERLRAAGDRILEIARRGPHSKVDPGSIRCEETHDRW